MAMVRICSPSGRCPWAIVIMVCLLAAGCARPALLSDQLAVDGELTTTFSVDDNAATMTAQFDADLDAGERFSVEWLFPDGKVYLRKAVRPGSGHADRIVTAMPIRGKAPARRPGLWQVRVWRDGEVLVDRSFEIEKPLESASSAGASFAGLAYCGPARWHDAVISRQRSRGDEAATPGAWIGAEVLASAGATYSGAVLLTGCAPG